MFHLEYSKQIKSRAIEGGAIEVAIVCSIECFIEWGIHILLMFYLLQMTCLLSMNNIPKSRLWC
jgi:hypothetical protein